MPVLPIDVPGQLVFAVILDGAEAASVGLILVVSSLVVVPVADRRELLGAVLALVGSLSGVDSVVNLEVSSLIEDLVAEDGLTCSLVFTDHFATDEGLLYFLALAAHAWLRLAGVGSLCP